jgi:hypothetical protein
MLQRVGGPNDTFRKGDESVLSAIALALDHVNASGVLGTNAYLELVDTVDDPCVAEDVNGPVQALIGQNVTVSTWDENGVQRMLSRMLSFCIAGADRVSLLACVDRRHARTNRSRHCVPELPLHTALPVQPHSVSARRSVGAQRHLSGQFDGFDCAALWMDARGSAGIE